MAKEINLVPDVKAEMIKTLKLRNFIFFLCIVVTAASIGVTAIFWLTASGQQLAIDSKKNTIDSLSSKINLYGDLNDFLTIKDQLNKINTLTEQKQVLSRTFNILSAIIPAAGNNDDQITISELNVNLSEEKPSFTFDAQADARKEPFIDYNVLDAFKKSMQYMHYDYGRYVDKEGNNIPAYCIIESNSDGMFKDSSRGRYAYWTIDAEGCNQNESTGYTTETYEGQNVVKIWRTPQFTEWYKENPTDDQPSISLDGTIKNVPHFKSSCITYSGNNSKSSSSPEWSEINSCKLVPEGTEGIRISDSSNGRGASGELVLRFSAVIEFAPEVYKFSNYHMVAIGPSGRYNVTDSYVQVQAMFGERAADCAKDDTACNSTNNGGNNG
ncbi:hypothetical protein IJG01_03305 [Candidatus Saccharibacteria bacterium]|nr:hypothetical protein [Candidatus Saccharibacteria bacterium]